MNNINPVNIDKSAEYNSKLQDTFKSKIYAKEENSSLFSNAFGDGPAVKVEISSRGAEMSEKVKNGEMPEGAIKQLERTPLTEAKYLSILRDQLKMGLILFALSFRHIIGCPGKGTIPKMN